LLMTSLSSLTMGGPEANGGGAEIALEAFGVRLAVSASGPELMDRIQAILPPGSRPFPGGDVERRFSLKAEETGTYTLEQDGEALSAGSFLELDVALAVLDSQLRMYVASAAPDTIFVHAGVVSHHGKAMVMPAESFGGKTTLVTALVRAGAIYYSDEFAVIDRDGLVHPYAKPL
jgi:hypothetical protein